MEGNTTAYPTVAALTGNHLSYKIWPGTQNLKKLYRGGWQGNVRHGHGLMTYPDGRIYEGQWVEDSREGFGTLTYPGVSRQYAGEWETDRRDGYGVMLYGRNSSYEVILPSSPDRACP